MAGLSPLCRASARRQMIGFCNLPERYILRWDFDKNWPHHIEPLQFSRCHSGQVKGSYCLYKDQQGRIRAHLIEISRIQRPATRIRSVSEILSLTARAWL